MTTTGRPFFSVASVAALIATMAGAAAAQTPAAGSLPVIVTKPVTFTKDVAPILQRSCVRCHRPGEIAPMSLMTYEEARPWVRSIKRRVASREMPPWHVDRTIGIQRFKDDPSLTDEEIAKIASWVDAGAPKGDPADMPPPRQLPEVGAWELGTPDVVIKYPKYTVPATGPDLFGELFADIPIQEDRYIRAIQTRSATQQSHRVVHHALSYAVEPDAEGNGMAGDAVQFLVEYASGKNAEAYPADSGVLLKAGQRAMVAYHLHPMGEEIEAEIEVGIWFHPKGHVPKYTRWSRQLATPTAPLDIPAGTVTRSDGYTFFHKPVRIIALQPHMHNLGKRQCLELIYPTSGTAARTEVINCVNFNSYWHLTYNYADEAQPLVPAGAILHNISWHDNTQSNPNALDPKNWVGDGQRTIDEMGFFWIGWIELTEEEYKQQLAERKAIRQSALAARGR